MYAISTEALTFCTAASSHEEAARTFVKKQNPQVDPELVTLTVLAVDDFGGQTFQATAGLNRYGYQIRLAEPTTFYVNG